MSIWCANIFIHLWVCIHTSWELHLLKHCASLPHPVTLQNVPIVDRQLSLFWVGLCVLCSHLRETFVLTISVYHPMRWGKGLFLLEPIIV